MMTTKEAPVRDQLLELAKRMPPTATWEEVMDLIYVRQQVSRGLQDIEENRTHSNEAVRSLFRAKH